MGDEPRVRDFMYALSIIFPCLNPVAFLELLLMNYRKSSGKISEAKGRGGAIFYPRARERRLNAIHRT